jgi:hypothetical protein
MIASVFFKIGAWYDINPDADALKRWIETATIWPSW